MSLGKRELIISIVMLIVFIIIGLNFSVFATSTSIHFNLAGNNSNNNSNTIPQNNVIPQNNTIEKDQERPQNNTVIPTNNTTNTNNSSTKDVPNTGLEDAPWLIIAVCGVSAIFAYKKIKEYNQI